MAHRQFVSQHGITDHRQVVAHNAYAIIQLMKAHGMAMVVTQ